MTAITITNTDWTIIDAVKTAIGAATVGGVTLFKSVTLATSEAQAEEAQLKEPTPRVIIVSAPARHLQQAVTEARGVEHERYCDVPLVLYVARKTTSGVDESARVQEIYRLANGIKNAVESSLPAAAIGYGDEDNFHAPGAVWGDVDIKPTEDLKQPWIAFQLPVSFGYAITNSTSH